MPYQCHTSIAFQPVASIDFNETRKTLTLTWKLSLTRKTYYFCSFLILETYFLQRPYPRERCYCALIKKQTPNFQQFLFCYPMIKKYTKFNMLIKYRKDHQIYFNSFQSTSSAPLSIFWYSIDHIQNDGWGKRYQLCNCKLIRPILRHDLRTTEVTVWFAYT